MIYFLNFTIQIFLMSEETKITKYLREKLEKQDKANAFIKEYMENKTDKPLGELKILISKHKEDISIIVSGSLILEDALENLILEQLLILNSEGLFDYLIKDIETPVLVKLKFLRFCNLITQTEYKNIRKLFRIRNRFAHKLFGLEDFSNVSEILKGLDFDNENIDKIALEKFTRSSDRFLYICDFYYKKLIDRVREIFKNVRPRD